MGDLNSNWRRSEQPLGRDQNEFNWRRRVPLGRDQRESNGRRRETLGRDQRESYGRRREPLGRDQNERWRQNRESAGGYQRPPRPYGYGHHPVPRWEKTFCISVCSVPWKKIREAEYLMDMYPKVAEWNDLEGKEAFIKAKARYWARINLLPSPTPLPDPNMYIDTVDYNATIDPELVNDLDELPPPIEYEEDDNISIELHQIQPTGWGDEEDQLHTIYTPAQLSLLKPIQPTGWGTEHDQLTQVQATGSGNEDGQNYTIYKPDLVNHTQSTGWDENDRTYVNNDKRKTPGGGRFGSNYTDGRYSSKKKVSYIDQGKLQWRPKNYHGPA